jgi:hypothetical protein
MTGCPKAFIRCSPTRGTDPKAANIIAIVIGKGTSPDFMGAEFRNSRKGCSNVHPHDQHDGRFRDIQSGEIDGVYIKEGCIGKYQKGQDVNNGHLVGFHVPSEPILWIYLAQV